MDPGSKRKRVEDGTVDAPAPSTIMLHDVDFGSFQKNGFLIIRGFASAAECKCMQEAMAKLIDAWDPSSATSVFKTNKEQQQAQGKDDYFISSADKVRFFLEAEAMDKASNKLREDIPKEHLLNKVGHALHVEEPAFREYCQSLKVRQVAKALGWSSPDLVQSMYIFKQPRIGGVVTPHQDSCFLRTEPLSCLGLWLALESATIDNGCLWARPGSHTEALRRHFARRVTDGSVHMEFVPLSIAEDPPPAAAVWEGGLPSSVSCPSELGFVPLPVARGDLVLIHGQLDHLSMPNTSAESRHSFQLHLVEGNEAGTCWSTKNWLQYPPGKPFPKFSSPAKA
mmetsp:Transcript_16759/g.27796  ORF Transcript_16759/g.27796 Transcript_16759/m.27796 type:complete len:339 (-) Transcript_16759:448-1464(-)